MDSHIRSIAVEVWIEDTRRMSRVILTPQQAFSMCCSQLLPNFNASNWVSTSHSLDDLEARLGSSRGNPVAGTELDKQLRAVPVSIKPPHGEQTSPNTAQQMQTHPGILADNQNHTLTGYQLNVCPG